MRSTNQAATVPTTAQSTITTTERLTVFHSSWAVRLRNSNGSSVCQPTWTACTTRKMSGRITAIEANAAPTRSKGRRGARPGRVERRGRIGGTGPGAPGGVPITGWSTTEVTERSYHLDGHNGGTVTTAARSQQLRLLQQLDRLGAGPQLGDRDGVRLELRERGLTGPGHARCDRVLPALAVGDDLLPLLRGEEG